MQRFNVAAYLRLSKEEFSNEKEFNSITNQKLIFLEPVMTEELLNVHKKFIKFMEGFDGVLNPYYDINKWMPHCTISIRLSDEELYKAIKVLKESIKLPIVVKVEKIDLINYPFNQILITDINE